MQLLYGVIVRLYYFLILISSPFNLKAKQWITGRRNLFKLLKEAIADQKNIIWFHCSSLGEFEQGRPVMEEYRKQNPEQKILLTFFSPSGYEVRKNYAGADWVFYMPLDVRQYVRKFLNIVNPDKVIFVKYEFWYHFLHEINKRNIPVYLISANFRRDQLFFKSYGNWYRRMLNYFTFIFVQNIESETLLKSIGINSVTVSGDTRFDRVSDIAGHARNIPEAEVFSGNSKVLVAGSTWPQDEELLVPFINKSPGNIKLIVAQHEISESGLSRLERMLQVKSVRFSRADDTNLISAKVLIIDNVGMLSFLYKYGSVAYIGGGFGKGIHNILEAAVFGQPVLFGPNYQKFSEAVELISAKGAFTFSDYGQLDEILNQFFSNVEKLNSASAISKHFVEERVGATGRIMKVISID